MTTTIYKASRTRSNRPGWSVTFNHPRRSDARGKFGLKVRRGLGTPEDAKADQLVAQLNEILADPSWWSLDRRVEALQRFDAIVVSAFFDGIEAGKVNSKERREEMLPLPTPDDGYARVMLVGSTGAGKTTLLRQLIGSDHTRDRFPSTSTAKTTTADIEIITTATGPFKSAITFMNEHEVRAAVDECLEEACASAIRGQDDKGIAGALLEHPEQRFRLSYPLGTWQQESPSHEEMDSLFEHEEAPAVTLPDDEVVADVELTKNNEHLREYVFRIRDIATAVQEQIAPRFGNYHDMDSATRREAWIEEFTDALYENQGFTDISVDIMESIEERFGLIADGNFEREATGWPILWYYEDRDRTAFLRQVRWFTGNHSQQFGRLLTPLVDGIRVSGPFQPAATKLQNSDRRLVLLDGEGLGHSAREATSISTKVTDRFQEADMILLIDDAQSPMQAAPLELLRTVGKSGHGHKLGVVFTHFDQVRGDNLRSYTQKVDHVHASIGNALSGMQDVLGPPVTEILKRQLDNCNFYLGGLNRPTDSIPTPIIDEMHELLAQMQEAARLPEPVTAAPIYNVLRLELALRDATDGFKSPWWGRLGLSYQERIKKEHWTRVKALCRRIANLGSNEYDTLKPVANLLSQLQESISLWLNDPAGWTRHPADDDEGRAAINQIRQEVSAGIRVLAERRLIRSHPGDWQAAYGFRGAGSSFKRADQMAHIYEAAAPSISSIMDPSTQAFLDEVVEIVRIAVENADGSVEGISKT
ncbi:MAG: hypothetical protein OXR67_04050 [Chloroflexota bacterium]|nr:hypothetical protein [Chloroflexota bacterium]